MSTETRSIEISYKADLQQLKEQLSSIPGLTADEAKKMVAALDKQLKQAEKAAQRMHQETIRAAEDAADAADETIQNLEDLEEAASDAADSLDDVGDAGDDANDVFEGLSDGLEQISPALGELVGGISETYEGLTGMYEAFTELSPAMMSAVLTIGILAEGFMTYLNMLEAAEQAIQDQIVAIEDLNASLSDQKNNLYDSVDAINDLRDKLALMNGEITQYQYDRAKAERETTKTFENFVSKQEEIVQQKTEELALINAVRFGMVDISDGEKERLHNIQLLTDGISLTQDLLDGSAQASGTLWEMEQKVKYELSQQNSILEMLNSQKEEGVDIAVKLVDIAESERVEKEYLLKLEQQRQAAEQKRIEAASEAAKLAAAEAARLAALQASIEADNANLEERKKILEELSDIIDNNTLSEDELKEKAFEKELQRIATLGEQSLDYALADQAIAAIIHKQKMDNLEAENAAQQEQFDNFMGNQETIITTMSDLSGALTELHNQRQEASTIDLENIRAQQEALAQMSNAERAAFEQKKKFEMKLFRFDQAAAIANVAFSTAKAIMEAMAYPPIMRGAMIATIAATGMAQAAIVAGQQPPSFHTGGIAPDEMNARLLKGEMVLDRATVRAIGGEQEVKNLQQHKTQDNVVVIQPFKHFGRFAKEIGFQAPKKTGIKV